jgi:hypothetical protein
MRRVQNTEFAADVAELTASYGNNRTTSTVPTTRPASPATGDVWFDPTTGTMSVYMDSKWVDIKVPSAL